MRGLLACWQRHLAAKALAALPLCCAVLLCALLSACPQSVIAILSPLSLPLTLWRTYSGTHLRASCCCRCVGLRHCDVGADDVADAL